jgi:hypothetical protein
MPNLANFAVSTVAIAPSPSTSGISLVVTTGQGALFPATPFQATVWPSNAQPLSSNAEIITVTAVSGDTLTIERNTEEPGTAQPIAIGWNIASTLTVAVLLSLVNGLTNSNIASGAAIVGSKLSAGTVPFNLFGAAASTGGGNPPAVGSSNFLMQAGKTTVTTNSHGNATINFPNSFPNGLLCFLPVMAGPTDTAIGLQVIDDSNALTNISFATIWAWNTPDGTWVNTGSIDILWIAIGF